MNCVLTLDFRIATSFVTLVMLFFDYSDRTAEGHQRLRPKAFQGMLHLTRAPRIGANTTLVLSVQSNLAETIEAEIQFRLPDGTSAQSPVLFKQVYFPVHGARRNCGVVVRVDAPGDYPLQGSIYWTLSDGRKRAQHFYTYLLVTSNKSEVAVRPFDEKSIRFPLKTEVRSVLRVQQANMLTFRGTVRYFDDNQRIERAIHRPSIHLYREQPFTSDIEIGQTFADEQGEYRFDNVTHPELNNGKQCDFYLILRFENSVLSVTNRFQKTYELRSETVRDVCDSEFVIDLTIDNTNPNRGIGHIFNTTQVAHDFLHNRLQWERDRPIQVVWPGPHTVSYYDVNHIANQVVGEKIVIAGGEDQWQRITVFHEYGHAVMTDAYAYSYQAVPRGSYFGTHRLETVSDLGFAFNEGWAEFMEAAVDNTALNVTGFLGQSSPNIETNAWWTGHVSGNGDNVKGELVEGTVASILWDIFDTSASIDLNADSDDDQISDRLDLFWEIFLDERPQNITDVAVAWRARNFPMLKALEEIFAHHHARSRPNTAPRFRFTSATSEVAASGNEFQIEWDASDVDGDDFSIDLFYDHDRVPSDSVVIGFDVSSNLSAWTWNTRLVPEGQYFLRAIAEDSRNARKDVYSDGFVVVNRSQLFDLNADKQVNLLDLYVVAAHFGKTIVQPLRPNPDINRDGTVNIFDLVLVATHIGEILP